jgi:hypothetical protein
VTSERSDRKAQATTGAEFDAALDQAEDLLASADAHRRAAWRHLVAVALAVTASAVTVAAVAATGIGAIAGVALVMATVVVDLALIGTVARTVLAPLWSTAVRDERCAVEIVAILRELLTVLSREEEWSLFRVQRTRLRMSRFGIAVRQR